MLAVGWVEPCYFSLPFMLSCIGVDTNTRQHKRKRKVTWFNPPYSQHVKTKIGEKFLKIVEKNFPKENQLHKICNRNTLRLSYSCMDNMATIIKAHNNTIMNKDNNKPPDTCNCRKKDECPLPGKCTTQNVIYEAKMKIPTEERTYIGLTASSFKTRYTSHKASFTHREKSNHTELSKYIWKLKDNSVPFNLIWSIKKHARPYNPDRRDAIYAYGRSTILLHLTREPPWTPEVKLYPHVDIKESTCCQSMASDHSYLVAHMLHLSCTAML